MLQYLKIKIINLADEARTIRREEKRWPGNSTERLGLYFHRIKDVRWEARSAQLAYGFLRNRTYQQLEYRTYTTPDYKRIAELVRKYGGETYEKTSKEEMIGIIKAWADKAKEMKAA